MNPNIWEIHQPNSVFLNQSAVSSENIQISNHMNSVYLWKLQQADEDYPEEGKSSLLSIVNKYIIDFFKVERGNDDELKSLTRELIKTLRKFIRNIKIYDEKFLDYAISEFSLFHNEIIDFQRDKALEILNSVKNTFKFETKVKKFLVADLDLDYEIQVFMSKVIQMKCIVFSSFYDLFISSFKSFIPDYSERMEEILRDYIEKSINDFNHKFEKSLAKTKNCLHSYLLDIVKSIDPVRITVLMREVPEDLQDFGPWMICFEKIIDRENVELKQVIYINERSSVITLAFKESNRLMILFNDQHVISVCEHDLLDSDTIVCEGSSRENLVFIHNKLRKAYIAMEADRKLEANVELDLFGENLQSVTSAVLLRLTKEIICIDQEGHFSFYSIKKKVTTKTSEIVPTFYKRIGLSACGNFIFLISRTETYVFTNSCELVIQDFTVPDIACLTKKKMVIAKVLSDGDLSFSMLPINSDYVAERDVKVSLTENLEYQVRNTFSFGRELIDELLKKKHFDKFVPPEVIPK